MSRARRTALVTGAGRNIGRATVLALAQDGFDVVVNGSADRAACEAVAAEARASGVAALVAMADVGRPEECARLAAEAAARFGAVDVLVNNAALRPARPFLEMDEAEWRRVIAVDLDAAVWLARACLPAMVARGWGRIVNIASMAGRIIVPNVSAYNASKAACAHLTRSLAREWARHGINVNALSPGYVATELTEEWLNGEGGAKTIGKSPRRRIMDETSLDEALLFLCSDAAKFVTGTDVLVDDGQSMG